MRFSLNLSHAVLWEQIIRQLKFYGPRFQMNTFSGEYILRYEIVVNVQIRFRESKMTKDMRFLREIGGMAYEKHTL